MLFLRENRYLLSETKGRSGWDHHPYTHHVHREGATAKKPAWLQTMAVSRPNARAHMRVNLLSFFLFFFFASTSSLCPLSGFQWGFFLFLMPSSLFLFPQQRGFFLDGRSGIFPLLFILVPILSLSSIWFPIRLLPLLNALFPFSFLYNKASFRIGGLAFFLFFFFSSLSSLCPQSGFQ